MRHHPAFDGSEAPIHLGLIESYQPMGMPYLMLLGWTLVWGLVWFGLGWWISWKLRTVLLAIPYLSGLVLAAIATQRESQWVEIAATRLLEHDDLRG